MTELEADAREFRDEKAQMPGDRPSDRYDDGVIAVGPYIVELYFRPVLNESGATIEVNKKVEVEGEEVYLFAGRTHFCESTDVEEEGYVEDDSPRELAEEWFEEIKSGERDVETVLRITDNAEV